MNPRIAWQRAYRLARSTSWLDLPGRAVVARHPFGRQAIRVVDGQRPPPVAVTALLVVAAASKWLSKAVVS